VAINPPKRRQIGIIWSVVLLGALGACGTAQQTSPMPANAATGTPDAGPVGLSCVLYARAASTIDLRGDAYTWWDAAAGRYLRGADPEPGAVLVLAKTDRLQLGHLAVVRQVIDARDILVDHSNWAPGRIITGMKVRDVSPANDWTALQFLNQSAGVFGATYPAYGFIYAPAPAQPRPAENSPSSELGTKIAAQ
jgi:hypothetical protein